MKYFKLKGLFNLNKWISPAFVEVDENGLVLSISSKKNELKNEVEDLNVFALPGFYNAHSHAFQYAMAGMAETHDTNKTPDDFWSWREAMYQLALSISPDELESIATQLYAEMLRHGYTHVAEFHYVHHQKNGEKFENLSEMSESLIKAAKNTGISITILPIFYQKGGFGKEPTEGQKRFISKNIDEYMDLFESVKKSCQYYQNASIGLGIHSMRGVEPEIIKEIAKSGPQNVPFHIHIAEQLKEIEDSIAYLNKRPVEWMLENIELNNRFHLVHATHLLDEETKGIANSGANVVLCPSTEGNLGDGIFPLRKYQNYVGNWSIGTDSHVGLNPFEELRILDYGQRLASHKRNTFYDKDQGDSGIFALNKVFEAGKKACVFSNSKENNESAGEYFKVGESFNAVLIDAKSPLIACTSLDYLASTVLYSSDISMQYGTIANGKLMVKEGKHIKGNEIGDNFVKTIKNLSNRV